MEIAKKQKWNQTIAVEDADWDFFRVLVSEVRI